MLVPTKLVDAGPYAVGDRWMTLWNYIVPEQLQRPAPSESVRLIRSLSIAMKDFYEDLPVLGVWERTSRSAERLMKSSDRRIQALLEMYHEVDKQMRLDKSNLIPCHGDAHAGNLVPSIEGWIWTDFEDVSLMPVYWDEASFVGNLALFNGINDPTFSYMLNSKDVIMDPKAFSFSITARILMSTLGNLDYAFEGYGDMDFAVQQLELAGDFIKQIDQLI